MLLPGPAIPPAWRRAAWTGLAALLAFGAVLLIAGKHPLQGYADTARMLLGSVQGFTELFVRMGPLLMTALAVAIPARLGLFNVGGEGQLYLGALTATGAALGLAELPAWLLLPATLLLNYVAPLAVGYLIFGPWRSADSASYPQSPQLAEGARLAVLPGTRLHAGLIIAVLCLALYAYVLQRTRWGLEMRAIGGNAAAAGHLGLPVHRYMLLGMAVGGGMAGLAGMAEVSAIQGRLVAEISPGYGYMGFLVAWLAGPSATRIVVMAFVFALVSSIGDVLQITQGLPFAVVNILMALILFSVLCGKGAGR